MTVTIPITVNEGVGNEALVDICISCCLFTACHANECLYKVG